MANFPIRFACGWRSNSVLEGYWDNSGGTPPGSIVAVPAATIGLSGPNCLRMGSAGGGHYKLGATAILAGVLCYEWYPVTNPVEVGGVINTIPSISDSGLDGPFIGWKANKQFCFTDNLGAQLQDDGGGFPETVKSGGYTAASPAWYFLAYRWQKGGGLGQTNTCWLRIYDNTRTLIEEIILRQGTWMNGSANWIRYGQVAGTSTCTYDMTNLAAYVGGGLWPSIAPNFKADVPDATTLNLNDIGIVRSDTGVDDAANEYSMVNELTSPDTDWLKSIGSTFLEQRFNHAAGLVTLAGAEVILAVGVTGRLWQTAFSAPDGRHRLGIRVGSITLAGANAEIQTISDSTANSTWGYQHAVWSFSVPSATPGVPWTVTDFDNVKMVERHEDSTQSKDCRLSQFIIYCIYGVDAVPPATIRKGSQVV